MNLTDEQAKQALECCSKTLADDCCKEYPAKSLYYEETCIATMSKSVLDYINRLEAENRKLQAEIGNLKEKNKINAECAARQYKEIERLKKTNPQKKCGTCIYAKPTTFGKSKVYVECTNAEHLRQYCSRSPNIKKRQRTNPACKSYKEKVGD